MFLTAKCAAFESWDEMVGIDREIDKEIDKEIERCLRRIAQHASVVGTKKCCSALQI